MTYVTRPRTYWVDGSSVENETSVTADQVIESDKTPKRTGLLDRNGDPLYRVADTVPFGFKVRA